MSSAPTRKGLAALAAVGALALGGSAVAGAASNGTSTTSATAATQAEHGPHSVDGKTEKTLTGDTAAKVKAVALAKVPGTVERVETNVDGSAPYEAHVKKADGTDVEVQVSSDFSVAGR